MTTENRSSNTAMVSVPREPTDEMIVAFAEAWYSKRQTIDDPDMLDAYAAMLAVAPAQQHQGEPVAYRAAGNLFFRRRDAEDRAGSDPITPLYTHADPAEIERLRTEYEHAFNSGECDTLRAQLAEAHALQPKLIDLLKRLLDNPHTFRRHICNNEEICELINSLSASAEPSAPAEKIKLHINVSNVHVTINPDGSYTIDPAEIDERTEFEKHYARKNDGFVPPFFDGEYDWHDAQPCWESWQARAALERKQ